MEPASVSSIITSTTTGAASSSTTLAAAFPAWHYVTATSFAPIPPRRLRGAHYNSSNPQFHPGDR